ncbi:hypothetical protein SCP_1303820 [Sparassis crispa]|uniref:Uncharacterized protein n=1 Tax=Sparassis crispa TaxID=139825 RepID=A0A401H2A7_9APHY|nr:hypothetical protein SCP_1303820 [Sparassis crispa]GBE88565.1 hypothetical protein SCP_1303820 [Sparassis crispa]
MASTASLARSAGPSLTRTLSNLLSPSLPTSPHPSPLPSASPRRLNKHELEAALSHAQVRAQARRSAYAQLGRGRPDAVFARTQRAAAGLGFLLPQSPAAPTAEEDEPSPVPASSPAYSPTSFSPSSHSPYPPTDTISPAFSPLSGSPLPSPIIYSTARPAFPPGLRFGLGIRLNPRAQGSTAWGADTDPIVPPRSRSRLSRDFPRTPGAPLIGTGSLRPHRHARSLDDADAYYHLPKGLLTPMTPVQFEGQGTPEEEEEDIADYFLRD